MDKQSVHRYFYCNDPYAQDCKHSQTYWWAWGADGPTGSSSTNVALKQNLNISSTCAVWSWNIYPGKQEWLFLTNPSHHSSFLFRLTLIGNIWWERHTTPSVSSPTRMTVFCLVLFGPKFFFFFSVPDILRPLVPHALPAHPGAPV